MTTDPRPSIHVYVAPPNPHLLTCVVCGRHPEAGDKVMETNRGEPRLLCNVCVLTAMMGFEDLDRTDAGYSSLVSPSADPF